MWNDIDFESPPEDREVLGFAETGQCRVIRYFKGKPNTFLKIVAWMDLPERPDWLETEVEIKEVEKPKKKRGRPKKS